MIDGIKYIFFDIGYTLVNEDAVWAFRCSEQAQTAETRALGLTEADIYREIEQASVHYLPQYRTAVKKFAFREVAPYRTDLETLYPDARAVLHTLGDTYRLGIIANQGDGLSARLDAFGIAPYFDIVISSWDCGVMKPDPAIFRLALERAGCAPQEAVMVGDRLDNDIAPANRLGMKTVWVKQGFGALQTPLSADFVPWKTVDSLSALPAIFQ